MRRIVVFFLFLCFYLSGRYSAAGTGNLFSGTCVQVQYHVPTQGTKENALLRSHRDLPAENDFPLFAEDDNDQEDFTTKKNRSFNDFSTHSFSSFSHPPGCDLTNSVFFRGHPAYTGSCKYLLQRVLRI